MKAVSVIMPVYNAGAYLAPAIESVLQQTLQDFELILIDDGSKDGSSMVCDEYSKKDHRVITIHQQNIGLCGARNRGIGIACGEYLSFIDHDDLYGNTLLEDNYRLAKKHNADVVKYGYIEQSIVTTQQMVWSCQLDNTMDIAAIKKTELRKHYEKLSKDNVLTFIWDALFKTSFIKEQKIMFDTSFRHGHEDRVFCMQVYPYINCLLVNANVYYTHMTYATSTSNVFSKELVYDTGKLIEYEKNLVKTLGLNVVYWQQKKILYIDMILKWLKHRNSTFSKEEIFAVLQKIKELYIVDNHVIKRAECKMKFYMYIWLLKNNYIKILANILIVERNLKRI